MLSRGLLFGTGCVVLFLGWQLFALIEEFYIPKLAPWTPSADSKLLPLESMVPQKRHRVAVASDFGYHFDVYMALVYAPAPFGHEFQTIVDSLRLFHGETKSSADLIHALNSNMGDGGIDMAVLGTCEVDLQPTRSTELLAAWDARDAAHKFQVVCIVHHAQDYPWQNQIAEWARRGAIRLLPISEHVADAFRQSFLVSAVSPDASIRSAGYEYIPVDVHVPVLDIPLAVDHKPTRLLSDAVIQGSFAQDRRDYLEIFAELKESFARDPKVWGYLPLGSGDDSYYAVDTTLPDPPFIPHELKDVVLIRKGLSYPDFYALMSEMDICVPAFSHVDEGGSEEYYLYQASSTSAMAAECNVPILVTERMKNSYTYVDDDRAVVTRPSAMREVEALRALRSGDASYFLNRSGISTDSRTARAAEDMLRLGWTKSEEESRAFKEGIWRANDRVVERLLRDL
ncbi:hypothetical protein C8R47DRAFT_1236962 [Mycena vitilis]|nr:hypothetical protein C8R47DRAFT_1236962 [Mycena vitilis]